MLKKIFISLVYALPKKQRIIYLRLPKNSTIKNAIKKSNILIEFPEIHLKKNKFGIFNKLVPINTILKDKDRIEIYRKLKFNSKKFRKKIQH